MSDSQRIYVIGGVGNVGKLVVHSLRSLPDAPPITLLVHTEQLLQAWQKSRKIITLEKDTKKQESSGYDVEVMEEKDEDRGLSAIKNLLVITKAAYTVPNLIRVAHRLSTDSTICFLQNGMGIVDEVNEKIFPDQETRPNYMQGIITHGMNTPAEILARDPFYAVHGGQGAIYLALLPRKVLSNEQIKAEASQPDELHQDAWPDTSRYLLHTMTQSPVLAAKGITQTELIQQQLQKLAVNSVVNPLTSLLDRPNGALLHNDALTRTIRALLDETSHIITELPELRAVPDVKNRLAVSKLEDAVIKQCEGTPHNISSMLSDLRIGQQTEIAYINGYIVRRGEELGIGAPVNNVVMQTVIGKQEKLAEDMKNRQSKL